MRWLNILKGRLRAAQGHETNIKDIKEKRCSPTTSTDWRSTMRNMILALTLVLELLASTTSAPSQTFASNNPLIQKMWVEGRDNSQLYPLAQELLDSIGHRLTGVPLHLYDG
jgi:hypothetical protein